MLLPTMLSPTLMDVSISPAKQGRADEIAPLAYDFELEE
jgi:hypothetical protein